MGVTYPRSEELAFGHPTLANTTVIAFTGTVAGAALDEEAMYRVVATEDCFVSFGTSNDATASAAYLPAGVVEYFATSKTNTQISVIQSTTGGNLHVSKMIAGKPWVL